MSGTWCAECGDDMSSEGHIVCGSCWRELKIWRAKLRIALRLPPIFGDLHEYEEGPHIYDDPFSPLRDGMLGKRI